MLKSACVDIHTLTKVISLKQAIVYCKFIGSKFAARQDKYTYQFEKNFHSLLEPNNNCISLSSNMIHSKNVDKSTTNVSLLAVLNILSK